MNLGSNFPNKPGHKDQILYLSLSTASFTYRPQSNKNPARAAVHCVTPSSNMRWYVVGRIKLPHTAGTSRSANRGTTSEYELPMRSNLKCPEIRKPSFQYLSSQYCKIYYGGMSQPVVFLKQEQRPDVCTEQE